MTTLNSLQKDNRLVYTGAFLVMLAMAFLQTWRTTHNLHWSNDGDFYRDIAFVQGTLEGHFGKDPNLAGAYLWYNPLVFLLEAWIVKISGYPISDVVLQAGTYLNLLSPLAFFIMLSRIFDLKIALAASLSFLFLATGNIPGCDAATYSPWLYPGCFSQFMFYINVLLCYLTFTKKTYGWFVILGAAIGINFLGHSAPAVLIILIMIRIQILYMIKAIKEKNYPQVWTYIGQGIATLIPFILASLPLLFFIVGKYKMHFLNRFPFEYVDTIFIWHNFADMLKQNVNIPLVIALVGFVWFYRNVRDWLIRNIFLGWFYISLIMFIYSTIVASVDRHFDIHLPGTVPSFHYFHYLKALQSVFFGMGFVYLARLALSWIAKISSKKYSEKRKSNFAAALLIGAVLLYATLYFPTYAKRYDFGYPLEHLVVLSDVNQDKIDAYHFIVNNIPSDQVILCEPGDPSIFPVMPSGRKMVSIGISYSNPYEDFNTRETDRNNMISFVQTGQPLSAKPLFGAYHVKYLVLSTEAAKRYALLKPIEGQVVFSNHEFTIFSLPM